MLVKLEGKDTATVVTALSKQVRKLPRRAATIINMGSWNGMAEHKRYHHRTDVNVFSAIRKALAARHQREYNRLPRQYFPKGTNLSGYPIRPEQDRATIESAPTQNLGISGACR